MPFTTACGNSPVVISSSSPAAEPLTLDWTPPSHPPERHTTPGSPDQNRHVAGASGQIAGDTTSASLSSPGLPSPSQLVKAKGPGVRLPPSGSRAQSTPNRANLESVSARSLAKVSRLIEAEKTKPKAKGSRKQAAKPAKNDKDGETDSKRRGMANKSVAEKAADAGGRHLTEQSKKKSSAPSSAVSDIFMNQTINLADFTASENINTAVEMAGQAPQNGTALPEITTPSIPTKRAITFVEYKAATEIAGVLEPAKKPPRTRAQKSKTAYQNENATGAKVKNGEGDKVVKRSRKRRENAFKLTEEPHHVSTLPTESLIATTSDPKSNAISQTTTEKSESSNYFPQAVSNLTPTPVKAVVRRRGWTPVKDTEIIEPEHTDSQKQEDATIRQSVENPRVPLGELLANFAYSGAGANTCVTIKRSDSDGSATKRRRVDPAGMNFLSAVEKRKLKAQEKLGSVPKVPKSKAVKKKPQTITAVAIAAYHPSVDDAPTPNGDAGAVNGIESFQTVNTDPAVAPIPVTSDASNKPPANAVKPRKPRSKATGDAKELKAGKVTKRKSKAAVNAVDHRPPLYSPQQAYDQMMQQEFLFGTSSQLAAPESPTFIREMQYAMLESEAMQPSQAVTRAVNAPHGTCLSVKQCDRNLWRSAARDFKGGLHRDSSGLLRHKTTIAVAKQNPESLTEPDLRKPVDASFQPAVPESGSTSCIPDEPNEFVDIDAIEVLKPRQEAETPKKVLVRQQVNESPKWTHIDEISDDEPTTTPSPPRRRANAPSPIVRTLPLSPSKSVANLEVVSAAPLSTTAFLKYTDEQWAERAPVLFSKITSVIKKAPPSTDSAFPSWHEKILLYDPIVLEDLTFWLNEQNIRVPVIRHKKKTATKGRKKKSSANADDQPEPIAGMQTETIEEPLQVWMVQKWCEENSVCCLWKDGLRGGVKTKY